VPNASTIRRQVGGTQQLTIASISGTTVTTTATPFQLNNNGLTGTGGGVIPLSAGVTGLYAGTGQVIHIHAAGTITGGTAGSTSAIITLYVVPAASLPLAASVITSAELVTAGGLLIATSATGVLGAAATQGSFVLDADVQLDGQSNLVGEFNAVVFNNPGTSGGAVPAAITTQLLIGEADLNFVAAITLGGTEVGVIASLNEFALSLV
jgi:hypothetical protein